MSLNENEYESGHLEELKGSDYEIADGQPDIIGWAVEDVSGKKFGEVDNLLFSPQNSKVRYLVVDLDNNDFDLEDRKVLVPIGVAQLDEKDDWVTLPGVTAAQLQSLPEYKKSDLSSENESAIRNVFGGAAVAGAAVAGTSFYDHDHFDEDRFYGARTPAQASDTKVPIIEENLSVGKRAVETGGARLRSRLVERPVQETINLKEEHVNVERTTVDRPVTNADEAFKEMEIKITEYAEVPVVSKDARVVEEVSLSKEVEEKEETIRDTVRNTEVEVEKLPSKENTTNTTQTGFKSR